MSEPHRLFPAGERTLLLALAGEIIVFALIAPSFFTVANAFEVLRFSTELGLLAFALTPVLVTGGIDVSVGALMGLAAVALGSAHSDWHLPMYGAVGVALLVGVAGGALNAALIARLGLPPLIVTLGSLSLFRGVAEGLTQGAVNYSGFPGGFLFLGQGYLWGVIPAQLPVLLAAFAAYFVLLHRSAVGRALYAIGFTGVGARYAGIRVRERTSLVYLLSGLSAGLAGVIYVAHLGQARSDAGNGYELDAITAVVLGGTSVFGGRGTLSGTLVGLLTLAVLKNGLQLAALPSELVGVVTGVLLVATIGIDRLRQQRSRASTTSGVGLLLAIDRRTAVLGGTVLAAAVVAAVTGIWLVRSVDPVGPLAAGTSSGGRRPVIAMMPKAKGDPYFISCLAGAEEAAKELGVDLIWDGPTGLDAARQNELVESWITRGVDVIAVAVENRAAISTVLRKARARGIRVLTWDADAEADARDYFVNQATSEGIANALTDDAARLMGGAGEFAIITGALSAANQNEWIAFIRKRLAERYPKLTLATIRPSDDDRDKAFAETQTIMRVHPQTTLVMAISAPAVPGAAEAVRQAGRTDIKVIGLSLPNLNKPYVHGGIVQTVVLWNTRDLGYLTVSAAAQLARQQFPRDAVSLNIGRLGVITVRGTEIVLGPPLVMNAANIDNFDF
jgi:rhamnose transport system substrate-binding protein